MLSNNEVTQILSELKPLDYDSRQFFIKIDYFLLKILINSDSDDKIMVFDKSHVYLYECDHSNNIYDYYSGAHNYIDLRKDNRFANYKPIKYDEFGRDDGNDMPILNLIELIKYLYRLNDLSIFT
ncbi:hypothetical protein UFOVP1290_382 [uncultured Caudovirales phage]|uniref:Uncharacterized protein n=1 Tax=uncultured Caudovirales phage TaxID=2100421 RepID=A0A6J5RLC9_9CAUD|nr:hypothetical protein UFOVP1290_382 [uncultured Caudovirales phage]